VEILGKTEEFQMTTFTADGKEIFAMCSNLIYWT